MEKITLFCKSYDQDVLRVERLVRSVDKFNVSKLMLYVSVPRSDIDLFKARLGGRSCTILCDEEIIAANPRLDKVAFLQLPGRIAQQIVKSEYWRLNISDIYLCLDSDCLFLRPFSQDDFVTEEGVPYTVMHEAKELLHFSVLSKMDKVPRHWKEDGERLMQEFGRRGRLWDFGPVPVVWSGRVWRDLEKHFLLPRGMTFLDAIRKHPYELRWYGEAILAYKSVPLMPIEPLFRCYHYEEQFYFWKRNGENSNIVAANYLGICMQSNWDSELDRVRRFKFSRLRKRVRNFLFQR